MDEQDIARAKAQYRGWVVVDVLEDYVEGQVVLKIQSPDGTQETLVTGAVALFGEDDPE